MQQLIEQFRQAHQNNTPFPSLSAATPAADIDHAYRLQRAFVDVLPGKIIGYKAALTAPVAQASMGIDRPVMGVLFDWGRIDAGSTLAPARRIILETELGFRISRAIDSHVTPATVPGLIASVSPMIEIAAPNLVAKSTGIDLIATNAASYQHIEGMRADPASIDVDGINAALSRDGEVLHNASSSTVMQGQWTLAWLINQIVDLKYALQPGMLLMTGAIGAPQPAKTGSYRADFTGLGSIAFEVP
jgi:2-keto-4-pentenoate hydratase